MTRRLSQRLDSNGSLCQKSVNVDFKPQIQTAKAIRIETKNQTVVGVAKAQNNIKIYSIANFHFDFQFRYLKSKSDTLELFHFQ